MSKIGIYPGSFDPITLGHLDIIQRSLNVDDKLIIAVSDNKSKDHMISINDRLDLIKKTIQSLPNDFQEKIEIEKFDNLLVHYVKSKNASLIIFIGALLEATVYIFGFHDWSLVYTLNVAISSLVYVDLRLVIFV